MFDVLSNFTTVQIQNKDGEMHSNIPSAYEIKTFYPTAGEFQNFKKYVEQIEIECHDMGFAKVNIKHYSIILHYSTLFCIIQHFS